MHLYLNVLALNLLILTLNLNVLFLNLLISLKNLQILPINGDTEGKGDRHAQRHHGHKLTHLLALLALPEGIKRTSQQRRIETHRLLTKPACLKSMVYVRQVCRKRLHLTNGLIPIGILLDRLRKELREGLIRRSVHQNANHMIPAMLIDEIRDLSLAPDGLDQIWRTDHDQKLTVIQRRLNTLRQVARNGQLLLVTEYLTELLHAILTQLLRDHVALHHRVNLFRDLLVQLRMAITDKGHVLTDMLFPARFRRSCLCSFRLCFFRFFLFLIHVFHLFSL